MTAILLDEHGVSDEVRRACVRTLSRMLDKYAPLPEAGDGVLKDAVGTVSGENPLRDKRLDKRLH